MKSVRWMMSYIVVAALGLWLAFAVSTKFMAPAHSQEQPPPPGAPPAAQSPPGPNNGDLPPEFMNEVNQAQPGGAPPPPPPGESVPSAPPGGAANTQTAPPSIPAPPPQGAPPVMPGPENAMPMGDAVTAPVNSISDVLAKDNYIYDPNGKRDPFKPYRIIRINPRKEVPSDQLEPLQRWELDRLQIIGILWDVKTPRAMVRDPDGGIFTVTKNSKMGRNEGYISAIREGEIVVVETKYDEDRPIKETRVMEFKK
ncbi:pilus assembly protein PilP [Bdellovibrio sp. HCB209]|uniref:pilus assembly protein PilP n=1 Tax=Bdellovibrio sp. HCB209 TaxID=3394354 RepID=UPI0039B4BB39